MPEIRIGLDQDETPWQREDGGFGDMMSVPVPPPQPEPDLTPEQLRFLGFADQADTGPQLGGLQHPGNEAPPPVSDIQRERRHQPLHLLTERQKPVTTPRGEVCVYSGWPRRHVIVGKHCPHGMLELLDE